jgi:hypothetical protein
MTSNMQEKHHRSITAPSLGLGHYAHRRKNRLSGSPGYDIAACMSELLDQEEEKA